MKYKFWFYFYLLIICCNQLDLINGKGLIGQNVVPAEENELTFVAAIVANNTVGPIERNLWCTATLLSLNIIITTEHCFQTSRTIPFQVLVGSIDLNLGTPYYPLWLISYEQWAVMRNSRHVYNDNDIILIKTIREMNSPLGVAIVPPTSLYGSLTDLELTMAGWGKISTGYQSKILNKVKVIAVSNLECGNIITRLHGSQVDIPAIYMCTRAEPYALLRDGDSGGPLLSDNRILAINKATCPRMNVDVHPEKINLHLRLDMYKEFLRSYY